MLLLIVRGKKKLENQLRFNMHTNLGQNTVFKNPCDMILFLLYVFLDVSCYRNSMLVMFGIIYLL